MRESRDEQQAPLGWDALQTAFPGWGGRDRFDWWFRRAAGGPAADLLVLADGDVLVAGLAVVYRRVRVPAGPPELAGVLAAAWTEPGSRRTGCFSELVEPCAETTWRARGEFLCGGTNSSNPSPSSGESGENRTWWS